MAEVKRKQMWSEHTGNPICIIEDDILQNGFYYNKYTGIFEGLVEGCVGDEKRVFCCTKKEGNKYLEPIQLNISNREFLICSKIIAHESGTDGDECIYIAFTVRNRSRKIKKSIYALLMSGYSSVPKNEKTEMNPHTRNKKDLDARVGLIKALLDEVDPTLGAEFWDGTDFLAWGNNHNKFKEYTKIKFSTELYEQYLKNQKINQVYYGGKRYQIPHQIFRSSQNFNTEGFEYTTGIKKPPAEGELIGTKVAGKTIFWRIRR